MAIQGVGDPLWLRGAIVDSGVTGFSRFIVPALEMVLLIQGHGRRIRRIQPQHEPGGGNTGRLCRVAGDRHRQQQSQQGSFEDHLTAISAGISKEAW
ncbi:hypothetical protein D3C86_1630650 [compost metagenome]